MLGDEKSGFSPSGPSPLMSPGSGSSLGSLIPIVPPSLIGEPSKIVDYILLAEFDIDKGSTVRHQYPARVGVSESLLSECMLPEGAHLRETDWTIYFIRESDYEGKSDKTKSATVDEKEVQAARTLKYFQKLIRVASGFSAPVEVFRYEAMGKEWVPIGEASEKNYVVSFKVNGEPALRAAPKVSVALSFGSTELRIDIPKEAKDTSPKKAALGPPFREIPITSSLSYSLSDSDNCATLTSSDGSAIALVFRSQDELLKFEHMFYRIQDGQKPDFVPQDTSALDEDDIEDAYKQLLSEEDMLLCLNLVRTKLDKSVRRGAIVKAMTLCSHRRDIHVLKSVLLYALNKYFDCESPEEGWKFLEKLYKSINSIDLSDKVSLNEMETRVLRAQRLKISNGKTSRPTVFRSKIEFEGISMPLSFPIMMESDEVESASIKGLFKKFEDSIMIIFNAILIGKRVLFLGHNEPAADVCKYVLSACLLVSPPLRGILRRCVPYAHLTDIKFLDTPGGYIAGVTNPIFEQHADWWDVLCDLKSGGVRLNPKYQAEIDANDSDKLSTSLDNELLSSLKSGQAVHLDEEWFRCQFRDYTQHVLDISKGIEEFNKDSTRILHTKSNQFRIEKLKKTKAYKEYNLLVKRDEMKSSFKEKYYSIKRNVRILQVRKSSGRESRRIYTDIIKSVVTKEQLLELLSFLPESRGGLFPLAVGIFHVLEDVKMAAFEILNRMDTIPEGVQSLNNLNFFMLITYHKMKSFRLVTLSPKKVVEADDLSQGGDRDSSERDE